MFSGLVEEMGAIQAINKGLAGAKFSILASVILDDLHVGDSVSVSGTCLTVTHLEDTVFLLMFPPKH